MVPLALDAWNWISVVYHEADTDNDASVMVLSLAWSNKINVQVCHQGFEFKSKGREISMKGFHHWRECRQVCPRFTVQLPGLLTWWQVEVQPQAWLWAILPPQTFLCLTYSLQTLQSFTMSQRYQDPTIQSHLFNSNNLMHGELSTTSLFELHLLIQDDHIQT